MVQLRRNHQKSSKAASIIKMILFLALLAIMLYVIFRLLTHVNIQKTHNKHDVSEDESVVTFDFTENDSTDIPKAFRFIPSTINGELIHHKYYSLSYMEKYEQAEWVAYELTKESIRQPNVPREKRFQDDPSIKSGSATYYDYSGSGYSRGHLAPAGDMAFSYEAMEESFLMSNMSPQIALFNGGVWNELENMVRDWAFKNKKLYIVTGPIFSENMTRIGKSKVAVPTHFYKVLLDLENPEEKAIGFILPNALSDRRLSEYAVSIDEVEQRTGLNFYNYLLEEEKEAILESKFDLSLWPLDENLYQIRINNWNKSNKG